MAHNLRYRMKGGYCESVCTFSKDFEKDSNFARKINGILYFVRISSGAYPQEKSYVAKV